MPIPGSKFVHPPYCFYRLGKIKENEVSMASKGRVHTKFLQYQSLVSNVERRHAYRQHDSPISPLPFVKEKFRIIKRTGENTCELYMIKDC
jgi:hypothetical protein